MGLFGGSHGFFGWIERGLGGKAADIGPDLLKLQNTGQSGYDYGKGITEEGLGRLRSDYSTYQGRLNDPLGESGRGIFSRARGALNDDAIRGQRAYGARIFQMARQSGGTLSPEAQAELQAQNSRDIEERRFSAANDLTNQEAALSLSETSKLFDRMDTIDKTILGVGQDEKTRGLQAIIAALQGRYNRNKAIADSVVSGFSIGAGG
jgi:hypothetical protein